MRGSKRLHPLRVADRWRHRTDGHGLADHHTERDVAELKERGVVFESYDLPGLKTDEKNIAQLGHDRIAWFKDSEGNALALGQSGTRLLDLLEG